MDNEKKQKILNKIQGALDEFVNESECEWNYVTDDEYTIEEFNEVVNSVLYKKVESEPTTFVERLQVETREMVGRKVKLQTFLGGKIFPTLIRRKKHLLYKQDRLMSKLLEVLGERIELEGSQYKVSDDAIAVDKDGREVE